MSIARQLLQEFRPLFRLFDEPISRSPSYFGLPSRPLFEDPFSFVSRPAVDVTEEGDKYVLEADLPGVKKENIGVRIGDGGRSITIEGKVGGQPETTSTESGFNAGNQISTERAFVLNSAFTRTVWLPHTVDSNDVKAKLNDGVLTIKVTKAEDKESVTVPVQ